MLTCVYLQSYVIFGITFMTFYTEDVHSDSKAFDSYKGGAWFESHLGHWLSSLRFYFSPSRHIWDIKSWAKKWAWMGKDLEGRSHGLNKLLS